MQQNRQSDSVNSAQMQKEQNQILNKIRSLERSLESSLSNGLTIQPGTQVSTLMKRKLSGYHRRPRGTMVISQNPMRRNQMVRDLAPVVKEDEALHKRIERLRSALRKREGQFHNKKAAVEYKQRRPMSPEEYTPPKNQPTPRRSPRHSTVISSTGGNNRANPRNVKQAIINSYNKRLPTLTAPDEGMHSFTDEVRDTIKSSKVSEVLKAFTLPSAFPPIRFPNETSDTPTAVCSPRGRLAANFYTGATSGSGQILPAPNMFLAMFHTPQRAFVIYDANTAGASYTYNVRGCAITNAVPSAPGLTWQIACAPLRAANMVPIHIVNAVSASDYAPHGPVVYAGSNGVNGSTARYMWFEQGTLVTFNYNLTTMGITASFQINADLLTEQGVNMGVASVMQLIPVGTTTGSKAITIPGPGYYSFTIVPYLEQDTGNSSNPFVGTMTITSMYFSASSSVFCHLPASDYANNVIVDKGSRINAFSMMYSNTSNLTGMAGQLGVAQIPGATSWHDYAMGAIDKVLAVKGAKLFKAETGCYGFFKPGGFEDFDIQDGVYTDNGVLYDSRYNIFDNTGYLVMYITVPDPNGRAGYFTYAQGIEYQTTDQWRDQRIPSLQLEAAKLGLTELREIPQFHENPLHLSELLKSIATATKKGLGIANDVVDAVSGIIG